MAEYIEVYAGEAKTKFSKRTTWLKSKTESTLSPSVNKLTRKFKPLNLRNLIL
jgi:hypothetical protein